MWPLARINHYQFMANLYTPSHFPYVPPLFWDTFFSSYHNNKDIPFQNNHKIMAVFQKTANREKVQTFGWSLYLVNLLLFAFNDIFIDNNKVIVWLFKRCVHLKLLSCVLSLSTPHCPQASLSLVFLPRKALELAVHQKSDSVITWCPNWAHPAHLCPATRPFLLLTGLLIRMTSEEWFTWMSTSHPCFLASP